METWEDQGSGQWIFARAPQDNHVTGVKPLPHIEAPERGPAREGSCRRIGETLLESKDQGLARMLLQACECSDDSSLLFFC